MKKICVIYGATETPIDSVRNISNFSSGKTGAVISHYLIEKGCEVTVLRAKSAVPANEHDLTFTHFKSLKERSLELLDTNRFDAVIMLAAVSDYEVDKIYVDGALYPVGEKKIPSNCSVQLKLKPTEKLIALYSKVTKQQNSKLIAFKLTSEADVETIKEKIENVFHSGVDGVVHNDLSEINSKRHSFSISINGELIKGSSKEEMAQRLYEVIL